MRYHAGVFTSVLCPVDFSEHSERALRCAIDLAALSRAQLTIVTAVDPFMDAATAAAGHAETLMQQTQNELQQLLARVEDAERRLAHTPSVAVVTGKPADAILDQIAACGADVVVMGTQGLSGTKRLFFGSTTEQVLRRSPVPVLAVPPARGTEN